ncbi:uncharacterized protein LOC104884257 [Beta vulgaris subsp. vulgaris]|uniref:uncharacterized protein LOC104884257 n=1 Tax=Beta vulgaris subsp. vulgaris TaxID=3555 RepID=UPI0020376619|nr:uncharacterized protein LOC104884257 [Beta vulgaris subsp. vulgaris]
MATPKTIFHTRSISLPSRPTTLDVSVENCFRRLRVSQAGPSSSSSVCQNLCSIKDLYRQMNKMVHLPQNKKILSDDLNRGEVEEVLEGSLVLLDISSSTIDALCQTKESVLNLESALRRGSISEAIDAYMMSRKKINKTLSKCLVSLKKAEKCYAKTESRNNNAGLRMLKEAESASFATLKSMISYVIGKKVMSPAHGWSLVAKLVKSKHINREREFASEVEDLDRVLCALSNKTFSSDTKILLTQLEVLEMVISELQNQMDSVSRCFIKTRVSLLNILN